MVKRGRAFTSHVKQMTLTLVLPHPDRWFYQREIQRITGIAYTPVRAALLDLSEFGLLKKEMRGNRPHYTVDKDFFLYEEYKNIVLKTTGLGDHLRWAVRDHRDRITVAFIHGDYAEGAETTDAPIRLCCIGTIDPNWFNEAVATAGQLTLKQHECLLITPDDFIARCRRRDPEITRALEGRKLFVVNAPADLKRLVARSGAPAPP